MSTERMNDNQGTARMNDGTDRMDAGTARMGANKAGAGTATGVVFASRQAIVLNGRNCVIDCIISGSSGEAVVYIANQNVNVIKISLCQQVQYRIGLKIRPYITHQPPLNRVINP